MSGIVHAVTDDGLELPVIDLTEPAFALQMSEAQLSAAMDEGVRTTQLVAKAPPEAIRAALASSRLARETLASVGGITSGMTTYLLRLGPANLDARWATDADRRFASGLLPLSLRFRLRDMARRLADELVPVLAAESGTRLELLSLAGGPAMEALNALLLIRKERPELLAARAIHLHVLDLDEAGPRFGARAAAALCGAGGALAGLDLVVEHVRYDWNDADGLRPTLARLADGATCIGSCEGGVFDYGSDEVIVANLRALREAAPEGFKMVGSVVRAASEDPRVEQLARFQVQPAVRYLGIAAFRALARDAGWSVTRSSEGLMHHIVTLEKL